MRNKLLLKFTDDSELDSSSPGEPREQGREGNVVLSH